MALAASLLDGTALKWTSMLFLMSSLIGGLLRILTARRCQRRRVTPVHLSCRTTSWRTVWRRCWGSTARFATLFPNTIAAIFSVGCGVMFILMPIILAAETEEEMFMSAGSIRADIRLCRRLDCRWCIYSRCVRCFCANCIVLMWSRRYLAMVAVFKTGSLVAGTDSILSVAINANHCGVCY